MGKPQRKTPPARARKPATGKAAPARKPAPKKKYPSRTAPRPHPLRRALGTAKYLVVAAVVFFLLKGLYDYQPVARLKQQTLAGTRQAGLRVETVTIYDRKQNFALGTVALERCPLARDGRVESWQGCFRPAGDVAAGGLGLKTSLQELSAAMQVQPRQPILAFDPRAARERLRQLPWIEDVVVSRRFPQRLLLAVKERQAAAYWEEKRGQIWIVDAFGRRIVRQQGSIDGQSMFVLRGEGAPQQLPRLLELLERTPRLRPWVIAATWTGGRRWTLGLRNGVEIELPEERAATALATLLQQNEQHQLFTKGFRRITIQSDMSMVFLPLTPPAE